MAITITDLRTLVDHADSVTGWSSPVAGEALTLFTTDPNPVEETGSIGMAVSIQTSDLVFTKAATNLGTSPGTLVYVWVQPNGTMDTLVNGGVALTLGDGVDTIGFHIGGSDASNFRHETGPVGWQCLVLDTSSLPANTTAYRGALGSLDYANVTEFGSGFKTLSKALGGASNCFTDTIRYGNLGIEITAGTSGTPSNWADIFTEDRSTVTTTAYGIARELGSGLIGLQGPLVFGDADDTTATFFADTNKTVVFEDRNLGIDKYSITVRAGGATGTTTFRMGTISGSDQGVEGVDFLCPIGVGASFDASNANLQSLLLYGSSFTNYDQGMLFSADVTNGPNHDVFSCDFTGCSQIDPGKVDFRNNSIADSTSSATGAILLDSDGTGTWSDLSFVSGGTGHAIYITASGTYNLTDFLYSGYSATSPGSNPTPSTGSTDAIIYNNSAGAVTLNIVGGDTVTVRNGASATTVVNNNITLSVTIANSSGTKIPGTYVQFFETDGTQIGTDQTTDDIGEASVTTSASSRSTFAIIRQSANTAQVTSLATDQLTTTNTHKFHTGDAVVWDETSGSITGLTNGTTYYVEVISASVVEIYTTAALAIAAGGGIALSVLVGNPELNPIRYINNSATITIAGADVGASVTMVEDTIAKDVI